MAVGAIGGREYYTDIVELTSGTTNCTDKGRIKGLHTTSTNITLHFPSGILPLTPTEGDILPFAPLGVTFTTGGGTKVYGLY